jgi:hypothetical protein
MTPDIWYQPLMRRAWAGLLVLLVAGCDCGGRRDAVYIDTGPGPFDAGPRDAGPPGVDAGDDDASMPLPDVGPPMDTGPQTMDAGPPDGGPPDAGRPDAGPPDAGPRDSGPPDAGPPPPDAGPPTCGGGLVCDDRDTCTTDGCTPGGMCTFTVMSVCATCSDMDRASSIGVCLPVPPAPPRICTDSELVAPLPATRVVFDSTGADQTFVVPAGVTRVVAKLWGAGGSSYAAGTPGGPGGAGAFVLASLTVTPGESLTIIAGATGGDGFGRTPIYGGGGEGGYFAPDGGGRSAIRRGATELVTAAGGGGGASCNTGTICGDGGAGGANRGEDGVDSPLVDGTYGVAGTGATHACGGSGGYTTGCGCGVRSGAGEGGRAFQGGSTIGSAPGQGGGGGGGGWLGGGSGGGDCAGNTGGGGGGGSSHVDPAIGCARAGVRTTPGNSTDVDRGLAATGAASSRGGLVPGGAGRVVLYY